MQRLALQQFSLAQQQCAQEVGIYNCPIHNIGLAMSRMRTLELGRYELNHMLNLVSFPLETYGNNPIEKEMC